MIVNEAAENVEDGGVGDCCDGVDAACALRIAACEIYFGGRSLDFDCGGNADWIVGDAVVIQEIFAAVCARRNCAQSGAHHFGGIFEEMARVFVYFSEAVFGDDFGKAAFADAAGGDLRGEIAFAFVGRADVVENHLQDVANDFPACH